jgi:ABC-type transporter Mla subunit MlaD
MANHPFLIAVVALAVVSPRLAAQDQPAQKPMDMDARRQSVVTLHQYIEQREARLAELNKDIRTLDGRIEHRIDELVKMLASVKDSQNSMTRIAHSKSLAIKGLRKMIQVYLSRRADILSALEKNASEMPADALNKNIEAFDKRIEKRIQQILELSKSMDQHQDVKKYERDGGTYLDGWYEETSRVNEDWKQNRRQTVHTDKQRRELIQTLKDAVSKLEQRRASIQDILDNRNPEKAKRDVQLAELGRVDAMIERTRRQIDGLVMPSGNEPREAVNRNQAMELVNLIADSSDDVSRDFGRLLRMVGEYVTEQTKLFQLSENLKAREQWLKEHDTEKSEN